MSDSATLEWVCGAHEERVARVFAELALERPELASVRDLWQRGEAVGACEALLDHFRGRARASGQAAQAPPPSGETDPEADAILADTFTFQNVTGMAPRLPDGTLDWTCRGPNDDAEWAFMLNRHDHLNLLVDAYLRTGHRAYGRRVDADLREWVLANPYPGAHTDDPRWRGLEVMSRISVWPQVLARLADDPVLQPGTRLLVLSCLPDHAHSRRSASTRRP